MSKSLTTTRLLLAAVTTLAAVGLAKAADPVKAETQQEYIDHLRQVRSTLNHTRKMLKEEEAMSADDENYKTAMKSMETAVDAVNKQVIAFEKAHPNLMPEKKDEMMKK